MAGPIGTLAGAVIGGIIGAVTSGAVVTAIDKMDHGHTVSGPDSPTVSIPDEAPALLEAGPAILEADDASAS